MALGESSLNKLYDLNGQIGGYIGLGNAEGICLYSTWNTFQYVAKNLSIWADDTIIGAEVKQSVLKLSNSLYSIMTETNKLNRKVDNFFNKQMLLNGGFTPGDSRAFQ